MQPEESVDGYHLTIAQGSDYSHKWNGEYLEHFVCRLRSYDQIFVKEHPESLLADR